MVFVPHCLAYFTVNKGQEKMKNTISELKNTVEGIY